MRQFDKVALLEEELHDLKLRLELCEADKKAYVETTQWTVKQNKDEMTKLKANNKSLADEVSGLKKYDTSGDRKIDIIGKLDQRILDLQKKLDDYKASLKSKTDRLSQVQQSLEAVESPEQVSDDNRQDMIVLENKLDKVMIKYNECATIRKIYEQIIRTLNEERTQFDQQLAAFERTLKVKRQDAQELEQMAHDAQHARDVAKSELAKFELKILEERRHREKEIQRLKDIIKLRRVNDDRNDRRAASKGDEPSVSNDEEAEKQEHERDESIIEMEDTLRVLKDSTGISSISEMLQKMRSLHQTSEQLTSLKAQYEQKLQVLRDQNAGLLPSPSSKSDASDSILLEKQRVLSQTRKEVGDAKVDLDKLARIMSNIRLGVHQLHAKLDVIKAPVTVTSADGKLRVEDETASDAMKLCVEKLSHIHKVLSEKESAEGEIPLPSSTLTKAILPQNNVRVKSMPVSNDDDKDDVENDNDVLDRDTLKRYTAQMLNARIKTKATKKKKKGRKDDDFE